MSKSPNWEAVESEALELFRGLLRIDTTNPPGDEIEAAEYLAEHLEDEGIDPWVVESAPGRGNLVARLPATVEEPSEEPLLLAGHTDVVPAEAEAWSHPPFEAVRDDGCIWGRGAVDMKNMVAMSAMVIRLLDRLGVERRRDVVFAAVADEEQGCEYGSKFLVEEHPERVRASTMLGEVGGFWQTIGGTTYVPVQVAEKGRAHLVMEAEGTGGHGSIPRRGEAVSRLARAVRRVDQARLPHHLTEPVETFIRSLADHQGLANHLGLRGLLGAATAGTVIDHLLPDPAVARNFDALLHNTATPTVLRAGDELNVIPRRATCELDGRLLPGFDGDDLRREVSDVVDDPEIEIDVREETSAVRTPFDEDEVLEVVEEVVGRHASDAVPVPYMIPGYTDAQHFRRLGAHCYGFAPIKIEPERDLVFSDLFHGVDERIPVEGFEWGLRVLFETVRALVEPSG